MAQWGYQPESDPARREVMPSAITEAWVEQHIVPRLLELSRRGVVAAYDSGVSPQSRARELDQAPAISSRAPSFNKSLRMATANSVASFDVDRGQSRAGVLEFSIRASASSHLQCTIGSIYFVCGVTTSGARFSSPGTALMAPDVEVYSTSTGTLASMWRLFFTGVATKPVMHAVLKVKPTSSLSTITGHMAFSYRLY